MFTIYGGKTEFSQWEQGQRVTNPKLAVGDKVRFWNASGETHPMIAYMHEGVVVADVPNDLLQHCSPILVELCGDPECLTRFIVIAQDKPAGYKFIDNTFCEPAAPSSGGGVSCWNDIPDKPFVKVGGDTLTWDGNTEGLVTLDIGTGSLYYRVSDVAPSLEDFANGVTVGVLTPDGIGTDSMTYEDIASGYADGAIVAGVFAVILEDIEGFEKGVYLVYYAENNYLTSLTIPGYTGFTKTEIKPIKPEYLPGAVVLYADESSYLYATEDISDTSKRITKAELQETLYSGRAMYLNANGMFLPAALVAFSDTYGMFSVFDGESSTGFYTAEYTA